MQDRSMLTSSQAVKWPSSKSGLQSYPFHHIFAWSMINFSCQNDYPENSSLQGFAGKCNHSHVPVRMYKQLDWRLESVLDKLELTLTDLMCRAFSWCGNLTRCRDHLSAPTTFMFQKSRLGDVLMGGEPEMVTFALQTCTNQ